MRDLFCPVLRSLGQMGADALQEVLAVYVRKASIVLPRDIALRALQDFSSTPNVEYQGKSPDCLLCSVGRIWNLQ
ncbi:hypothetical protein SAMN04488047_13918 [Tranquillimonas alkanivorans]|uniref:Uncharacterized protein n=1 Tax=Tranquillimonas alkanivorans TaxID=441119 RepID=A0A1I5W367_9RHOB|nr:hypothetical protein SAMN04488047_13918 [Tranquillimonas alkanivorans]